MTGFRVRFTPEAASCFAKLHPDNKKMIKSALEGLAGSPFGGHELQGELIGFRSYRVRRYRVVYRINEEQSFIEIYHVGHRRDVYEQFRRLLNRLRKE